MSAKWSVSVTAARAVLAVGIFAGINLSQPVFGTTQRAPEQPARFTRFTVVHTEGTNLIVTDNTTNTVYYYTTEQGAEPGSDLKLRGTVDLNQVGDQVIKAKLFRK